MKLLAGKKTYIAAAGLALLALVDLMDGHTEPAMAKLSQALGLVGLRSAMS